MNKYLINGILIFAGLGLIFVAYMLAGFDYKNFSTQGEMLVEEYSFDYNNQDINILDKHSNIEIKTTTEEKIKIELSYFDGDEFVVTDDSNITIENKTKEKFFNIGIGLDNPTIIIYVPENFNNEVDIIANVGDINIENLTLTNLNISTDVGEVNLDNLSISNELKITSSLGTIDMDNVNSKMLNISSDVGDVDFDEIFAEQITIKSSLGNVEGSINESSLNYRKLIDVNLGHSNIKSTNEGIYNLSISSDIGNIEIDFIK